MTAARRALTYPSGNGWRSITRSGARVPGPAAGFCGTSSVPICCLVGTGRSRSGRQRAGPGHQLPAWASAALTASRRQFEIDYEAARASIRADNEAAQDEALDRAERIYGYRRRRLTALIEDQDTWIREKEADGSERERRVLPARRGQVAKNRERLSNLQAEHEIELDEIRRLQPGLSAAVLAAGVVIGG